MTDTRPESKVAVRRVGPEAAADVLHVVLAAFGRAKLLEDPWIVAIAAGLIGVVFVLERAWVGNWVSAPQADEPGGHHHHPST